MFPGGGRLALDGTPVGIQRNNNTRNVARCPRYHIRSRWTWGSLLASNQDSSLTLPPYWSMYIYMCVYVYIYRDPLQFGGAERSLKRSVLYRTPEQGYWITVIFNYESTRILAKTGGAKPEPDRERGGGKKRKK